METQTADKDAAWDLYIELLTRITTQPLPETHGDEKTALESVYQLFPLTREIIRRYGRDCSNFTKLAIVVLNQIVRPFTAKWHRLSLTGAFDDPAQCTVFGEELAVKQQQLREYTRMLADMAGVEDLTGFGGCILDFFAGMARSYRENGAVGAPLRRDRQKWVAFGTSRTPAHDSTAAAAPFRA